MARRSNFISEIIASDLEAGRVQRVVTRFPPEPNGYLHIGHAKSICLNFGLAEEYAGRCHLRYDDTNPLTEDTEYVESIARDVQWLGFDWGDHRYFASDYFEKMYAFACELIDKGLAYVEDADIDTYREMRGTVTEPGRPTPARSRSVEENQRLFEEMRKGQHPDGSLVLRAKIDLSSSNMMMRDPVIYRIKHAEHHRTGDRWCIYPMYDFAHCIEDAIEGVTHSICTLEFENNRELYDWVIANISAPATPHQYEFARLNIDYTVMSKRKLLKLVQEGFVDGWDDPRMPTISGMRRRGVTPSAIRAFADMIGVARSNSVVDIGKLEYCLRDDLNEKSPRIMAVLKPLKVTITNYESDGLEWIDADLWPHDVPQQQSRRLPFGREILIDRDDFDEAPPKGWKRLAPGDEVRLRHAYIVRCDEVVKDDAGEIVELRCSYDPQTLNADPADGRKIRGVIHWVSATAGERREVRIYDRLFSVADPEADPERPFTHFLNPASLVVHEDAVIEPAFADLAAGSHVQFERQGYFYVEPEASEERGQSVFNRVVTLRDSWARKQTPREEVRRKKAPKVQPQQPATDRVSERDRARANDPALAARYERYRSELGLGDEDADVLSGDKAIGDFFEATLEAGADAADAARWIVNDLQRERKERPIVELPLSAEMLAELLGLIDAGRLTVTAAREVFVVLIEEGGDPETIMKARGLEKLDDQSELTALVDTVIADHPDEAARYREGKTALIGFFVGRVMQASGGAADAAQVRELLQLRLSS